MDVFSLLNTTNQPVDRNVLDLLSDYFKKDVLFWVSAASEDSELPGFILQFFWRLSRPLKEHFTKLNCPLHASTDRKKKISTSYSADGDSYRFVLAEISVFPWLQPWPFQVNPGKLFNSIKCVSQLKGLTINSQPDRESDQTCSNKYDLTGDIFNSFSGSFSFVFHCMLAACQCLTVPADSDLEALYHDP